MARQKKGRKFCFTINNYNEETEDAIRKLGDDIGVRYIRYGREVGASGTQHLQGFLYAVNQVTFDFVRNRLPHGAHIEACNGSVEENVAYVSKDGDIVEFGEQPQESVKGGKRARDWKEVVELAEQGKEDDFKRDYPDLYFRHRKTFRSLAVFDLTDLPSGTKHLWYYGETGTGKSHRARNHEGTKYIKLLDKWWDDYAGEQVIILEEWSPDNELQIQKLKLWADMYKFRAQTKGGSMEIRPRLLIITSNYTMRQCFKRQQDYGPLKRRFTEIQCLSWVDHIVMD